MRTALFFLALALISTAAAQAPQAPNVVIRSSAREVVLDVVVRDARGRLVNNLKQEQVTVLEDGVRQNVRSFRLVTGSEVRIEDEKQAKEQQALEQQAAATHTVPMDSPARNPINPLRTVNVVCLVLQDLNEDTRAFAADAAKKFVNNELRPNTFIGVFILDATGLRPVFPFSNNREHLLKAVQLAAVNQLPAMAQSSASLLNGLSLSVSGNAILQSQGNGNALAGTMIADGNADGSSNVNPLGTRGAMGFAVNVGLRELDSLIGLVRQLTPLPFQKTVLLMGTGLTRPPDQLEYWNSLIQSAKTGNVTFYSMDVWGLGVCQGQAAIDCLTSGSSMAASGAMLNQTASLSRGQGSAGLAAPSSHPGGSPSGGGSTQGPSVAAQTMESMHQSDYLAFGVLSANRQEALRELAESTGGFIIANTNNVEKLLGRVMEDVDTHYELSYQPTSENYDGHFRKVEVKLARTDLRAQTRSGYFALPGTSESAVSPVEMPGLRALDTKPRPHDFDFVSKAYRFGSEDGAAQYAIAFDVPISNLTATPDAAAKRHKLHASLLALIKNSQGQVVDRISRDVPSDVADASLPELQANNMTYERAISLAPGHYTVDAAVVDEEGNRASTNSITVDNAEQKGLGISDIALVRRLEDLDRPPQAADPFEFPGKRVLPFVSTTLPAGAVPYVYFVVYPEKESTAKTELRVQFLQHGQVIAQQTSELPPPDDSGRIPMVIAALAKAGFYEIRISAVQGSGSAERSLKYIVAGQ
jgi:VWFA-related protein